MSSRNFKMSAIVSLVLSVSLMSLSRAAMAGVSDTNAAAPTVNPANLSQPNPQQPDAVAPMAPSANTAPQSAGRMSLTAEQLSEIANNYAIQTLLLPGNPNATLLNLQLSYSAATGVLVETKRLRNVVTIDVYDYSKTEMFLREDQPADSVANSGSNSQASTAETNAPVSQSQSNSPAMAQPSGDGSQIVQTTPVAAASYDVGTVANLSAVTPAPAPVQAVTPAGLWKAPAFARFQKVDPSPSILNQSLTLTGAPSSANGAAANTPGDQAPQINSVLPARDQLDAVSNAVNATINSATPPAAPAGGLTPLRAVRAQIGSPAPAADSNVSGVQTFDPESGDPSQAPNAVSATGSPAQPNMAPAPAVAKAAAFKYNGDFLNIGHQYMVCGYLVQVAAVTEDGHYTYSEKQLESWGNSDPAGGNPVGVVFKPLSNRLTNSVGHDSCEFKKYIMDPAKSFDGKKSAMRNGEMIQSSSAPSPHFVFHVENNGKYNNKVTRAAGRDGCMIVQGARLNRAGEAIWGFMKAVGRYVAGKSEHVANAASEARCKAAVHFNDPKAAHDWEINPNNVGPWESERQNRLDACENGTDESPAVATDAAPVQSTGEVSGNNKDRFCDMTDRKIWSPVGDPKRNADFTTVVAAAPTDDEQSSAAVTTANPASTAGSAE